MGRVDKIVLGGQMVFTFLRARGFETGSSFVEVDQLETAARLVQLAAQNGVRLILPDDFVVTEKFAAKAPSRTVGASDIPVGWMGMDCGQNTLKMISDELKGIKRVIWDGAMGIYGMENFAQGTIGVAKYLADLRREGVITIIAGCDAVDAVYKAGVAKWMSHITSGGEASIELLEGKVLPGVFALAV